MKIGLTTDWLSFEPVETELTITCFKISKFFTKVI